MGPFPRPERQSDEPESHEKPTWPWEKVPEEKESKKKSDEKEEGFKKKAEPTAEKKAEPKKEEQPEQKPSNQEDRHERRSTLIEQSLALVAQYEEEPIPRDATTLARLMIAHQVVHLHSQLEHPEQTSDLSSEAIEVTLDYIAKLDAKFQNPTIELEPEIEQSYQEIIELAQATLEDTPNLEAVMNDLAQKQGDASPEESNSPFNAAPKSQNSAQNWIEQEFDRRKKAAHETLPAVATAAALVYAVVHLGRRKKSKIQSVENPQSESGISATDSTSSPTLQPPAQTATRPIEQAITTLSRSESITPPTRNEHVVIPPRRGLPNLATAAIATSVIASRSSNETPRPFSPAETHHTSHLLTQPTPELNRSEHATPIIEQTSPAQRKIEHMPLPQLLAMAETISLGQGQYLRREFEAGHIDKEGLVKILKSHAKGLDYRFEFRQQADKFAKLKATSPEFLHSASPKNDTPDEHTEQTPQETTSPTETPPANLRRIQPLSLAPPTKHDLLPELAASAHKPEHTARRLIVITAAALAGLAIVGWLALTIFNALS